MLTSLSTSTGASKVLVEPAGHVEAVPAGHDRRVDGAAGAVLDRAGEPDADREQVAGRAAELVEQLLGGGETQVEHCLGSLGHADAFAPLGFGCGR